MAKWECLRFWNGQNGLDFNISVLDLVFAAFLYWEILFWLHLNFYILHTHSMGDQVASYIWEKNFS